jgi:hypothetical protein
LAGIWRKPENQKNKFGEYLAQARKSKKVTQGSDTIFEFLD